MNSRYRQRFLRNFIASLMQSDLTVSDLEELQFDLENRSFNQELAHLLREATITLRSLHLEEPPAAKLANDEQLILSEIQRRKMSKRTLGALISKANPKANVTPLMGAPSTRGMLRMFFLKATPDEIRRLADLLTKDDKQDAYLRGIVRRD